eukprot:9896884-Alexandrium_andersonii.AAC.1
MECKKLLKVRLQRLERVERAESVYVGVRSFRNTSSQNWRVLFKLLRKMQHCSRRSNLELRGPRSGLKVYSQKLTRGARCAWFVQMPNPEVARKRNSRNVEGA